MLANDLNGQLARERVADLRRQAKRQRLVGLARTQRRGGNRGRWRGWHLLTGPGRASGAGVRGALDRPINNSTMTGPDATVAVSGTPSPAAEDSQIRFLTSKVDAGHSH
jgi:hypothetical protein